MTLHCIKKSSGSFIKHLFSRISLIKTRKGKATPPEYRVIHSLITRDYLVNVLSLTLKLSDTL